MPLTRANFYRSRDFVLKGLFGGCRLSIVRCTNLLETILRDWKYFGLNGKYDSRELIRAAQNTFGPSLAATIMANSFYKGDERTQSLVTADLNTETKVISLVEASRNGEVRGRFDENSLYACSENTMKSMSLNVTKTLYSMDKSYNSTVSLPMGPTHDDKSLPVDKLWNKYYKESEQIPTSIFTYTKIDAQANIRICSGITIQGLVDPSTQNDPSESVEKLTRMLCHNESAEPPLYRLEEDINGAEWFNLAAGIKNTDCRQLFISDNTMDQSQQATQVYSIQRFCPCAAERFARKIVNSFSEAKVEFMFDDGKDEFEVTCEICNSRHRISRSMTEKIRKGNLENKSTTAG